MMDVLRGIPTGTRSRHHYSEQPILAMRKQLEPNLL